MPLNEAPLSDLPARIENQIPHFASCPSRIAFEPTDPLCFSVAATLVLAKLPDGMIKITSNNCEEKVLQRKAAPLRRLISQSYCAWCPAAPCDLAKASGGLSESCPQSGTYRSLPSLQVAAQVPSAGTTTLQV